MVRNPEHDRLIGFDVVNTNSLCVATIPVSKIGHTKYLVCSPHSPLTAVRGPFFLVSKKERCCVEYTLMKEFNIVVSMVLWIEDSNSRADISNVKNVRKTNVSYNPYVSDFLHPLQTWDVSRKKSGKVSLSEIGYDDDDGVKEFLGLFLQFPVFSTSFNFEEILLKGYLWENSFTISSNSHFAVKRWNTVMKLICYTHCTPSTQRHTELHILRGA